MAPSVASLCLTPLPNSLWVAQSLSMLSVFAGAVASCLLAPPPPERSPITLRLPQLAMSPLQASMVPKEKAWRALHVMSPQPPLPPAAHPPTPTAVLSRTLSPAAAPLVALRVTPGVAAPMARLVAMPTIPAAVPVATAALADRAVMAGTAWPRRTPPTVGSAVWHFLLPRALL